MKNKTQIFSDDFLLKLKELTIGYFDNNQFKKLVHNLEESAGQFFYTKSSEANLLRVITSSYERISLLNDLQKFPSYVQILLSITFNSNYLTDIIVRNPEFLYWLFNSENLYKRIYIDQLKTEIENSLNNFKTFKAKLNTLRNIKRREILRIGLKDILNISSLKETTFQLSILAKAINSILFELCYKEVLAKYNLEIKEERYCLAALGKLGGNELNYSSDVDLVLFFDKNEIFKNSKKEYFEILTETTHNFIQASTELTDKGYIYRVDFRLRPDGRNSPICRTLKDFIQYYESRGEDWERQMMIKLSFVGGSKKLYDDFYDAVEHFIYPVSFSKSPLLQVALMKKNIEKKLNSDDDVKLFAGGIRDIEFSAQALQLLNGGKIKEVRNGNTLEALSLLLNNNLITSDEHSIFCSSYEFYRKIEHYLQLLNDTQTHTIPNDSEILEKLSYYLKIKGKDNFRKKLEFNRIQVRNIFESIVNVFEASNLMTIEEIKFSDKKRSENNFKFLQTGQGLLNQKVFDKSTIEAFKKIENEILIFLKTSRSPDLVLENFSKIIKLSSLPSIWYHEFYDKELLIVFLTICEKSQKAVDLLVTKRSIGELLLSRKIFANNLEDQSELSVEEMIFILSVQNTLGILSTGKLSNALSKFLLSKIDNIFSQQNLNYDFFVFGMGSFASADMTFNSDIDLIFVASDLDLHSEIQKDFADLLAEISTKLKPFEVDSRLRPEGKSAQLVWEIQSYEEYLEKRLQIWELQSLTKSKFVCGNFELFNRFIQKIKAKIEKTECAEISKEIISMREKINKQNLSSPQSNFANFFNIKKSKGGLTDIEFSLQYLLLCNSEYFIENLNKSTPEILEFFESENYHQINFTKIKHNFQFLKSIEIKLQNIFNLRNNNIPTDKEKREILSRELNFQNTFEFDNTVMKISKENRIFFESILNLRES